MSLRDIRAELVEAIEEAGYSVHGYQAEKIQPPTIIIDEDENYLEEGDLLDPSIMKVNFKLWLFTKNAQNKQATEAMDEMLEKVIFNLGDWTLTASNGHFIAQVGSSKFLASTISITKFSKMGAI